MTCICGNQKTEIKTVAKTKTLNGKTYHYETTYTYCPTCGEKWYTWEQARKDAETTTAIKRNAHGFLTPQEVKAIREKHGLSIEEAADFFICRVEEWIEYEKGTQYHSKKLDRMLRMFDAAPEIAKQINENSQYIPFQPQENQRPATI